MKRGIIFLLLPGIIISIFSIISMLSLSAVAQNCDLDPKCEPVYRTCGCGGEQTRYTLCNGGCSDWYPCSKPDTETTCNDGIDNDCDGQIDCQDGNCIQENYCIDEDNDGYSLAEDCNDQNPEKNPGTEEICNSRDDNCNTLIDENIERQCGISTEGICTYGTETCISGSFTGCTAIIPQTEICDGLDNNCDGQTDEGCICNDGDTQQCGNDKGACNYGTQTCINGAWGDCLGGQNPVTEQCQNNIDDDCDGQTDEGCEYPDPTTKEIEQLPTVQEQFMQNQETTQKNQPGEPIVASRPCIDNDNDGHGVNCKAGEDCNDADPEIYYGAMEQCDGKDNDCSGRIDELLRRTCGINTGACREGTESCRNGEWTGCTAKGPTEEKCNLIDDDCDGETDEGCTEPKKEETSIKDIWDAEFGEEQYMIEQKMQAYKETKDLIKTEKESIIASGKTKLKIKITAEQTLYDVYIYESIPKHIARNAKDIKFSIEPKIIKEDPLVGWHFKEITGDVELEYEVEGEHKDAHTQTETISYAESKEPKIKAFIPLALIPLVGLLFIVLVQLTKKKH